MIPCCAGSSRFTVTQETSTQARQLWEKALALDPQYAEAYAWLSWTYWREWSFRWSVDPQDLERALALAQQAVALDDTPAESPFGPSFAYGGKQQYDQAIAESERATALDPNKATFTQCEGLCLTSRAGPKMPCGWWSRRCGSTPTIRPSSLFQLGWAYGSAGRYAEAVAALKEAISRNSNLLGAHSLLALSYLGQWYSTNRIRMPRRWRRRWPRRNETSPSMPPSTRVTWSWALSIYGKSSMSRP